jgi:hypothetical protein
LARRLSETGPSSGREAGCRSRGNDGDGQGANDQVQDGAEGVRPPQADSREEHERRHEDATHRSQRVDAVQQADTPRDLAGLPYQSRHQHRQGSSHAYGRQQEDQQDDRKTHERRWPEIQHAEQAAVETRQESQHCRHDKRIQGNGNLHPAVGAHAVAQPLGDPTAEQPAEAEPEHVGDQNGADRQRRRAENQTQQASPHDLERQAGRAREKDAPEHGHEHRVETGGRVWESPFSGSCPVPRGRRWPATRSWITGHPVRLAAACSATHRCSPAYSSSA